MDISLRQQNLNKLKNVLISNKNQIFKALKDDFGKSAFESETSEVLSVIHEIDYILKRLKKWTKTKKVKTNWLNWPGQSYIIPEPLGEVLILGAWNYPLNLCLIPAVGAIAAGNRVVIKPSELTPKTADLLKNLIHTHFNPEEIRVETGGPEVSQNLINQKWDKIFFTGSSRVGKLVYAAAARNLTPVTLELGGKSPAIFDESCHWEISVKRLIWAKFFNAGQTCIAPDYVVVPKGHSDKFINLAIQVIKSAQYSLENENYVQIINKNHFERLMNLMATQKIVWGGQGDEKSRVIEPTLLSGVQWEDPIMKEEIFGPLLPILEYENFDQLTETLKEKEKPLALYLFSEKKDRLDFLSRWSFGGGAINEAVMQFTNSAMPFGGVGGSGFGAYHGEESFWCFSHRKTILVKPGCIEFPLKYGPLKNWQKSLVRFLMGLRD